MKRILFIFVVLLVVFGFAMSSSPKIYPEKKLSETLFELGARKPSHFIDSPSEELIQRGKDLIVQGRAVDSDGKQGRFISKYFSCLSCHNQVKEDPNPAVSDPSARLDYAIENKIPFLQATTFRGIVSRTSWYNGDYEKKYGDLVEPARQNLREAIQVCATQCAQGRLLEDWEMEAVLAYFWSIDYSLGELNLNEDEFQQLNFYNSRGRQSDAIDFLQSKYLQASPARFGEIPEKPKEGYPYQGDPKRGSAIYDLSCRHCHRPDGESGQVFDYSELTFEMLEESIQGFDLFSFYPMIRKGTYAAPGHRPYMPNYTLERMSDEQVEDLRAFIEQKANS